MTTKLFVPRKDWVNDPIGHDAEMANYIAIERAVGGLDARITVLEGDAAWTTLTLQNGWTNIGNPFLPARYKKLGGVVYVEGVIVAPNPLPVSGNIIAVLPVGYRPSGQGVFIQYGGGAPFRLDVSPSGISYQTGGAAAQYTGFNFVFPADQ